MTTMSGWNRRACSTASATVPASATTWKPVAPVEQRDEPLPDDLVVVDDQQPQGAVGGVAGSCRHVIDSGASDRIGRAGPAR